MIYLCHPTCVLRKHSTISQSHFEKIIGCLSTCFELPVKEIQSHLWKVTLKQYAKFQWLNNGDLMNAASMVPVGDDHWDATFVHVSLNIILVLSADALAVQNASW
jgi:hypothetical protein